MTVTTPTFDTSRTVLRRALVGGLVVTVAIGIVAGLAGLLVAEMGHNHPSAIKAAIQNSADDLGQHGTDPFYGRGRINVARALGL